MRPFKIALSNTFRNLEPQSTTLPIGRTVTSSFGSATSANTASVLISLLVVFHCPSKLLAWKLEPEPIGGVPWYLIADSHPDELWV